MEHIEITNLVYRVAEHLDQREPEAAAELFRQAQVRLNKDAEPLNHQQLLDLWQQEFGPRAADRPITHHRISNPIVEIDRAGGTARCRSSYLLLQHCPNQPLKTIASGRYLDEFVREAVQDTPSTTQGMKLEHPQWRFASRVLLPDEQLPDHPQTPAAGDNSHASVNDCNEPTGQAAKHNATQREKILAAAQQVFSSVGYSEAGIRRIAELVGVSPTILFRQFGTKANLFEEALVAAICEDPQQAQSMDTFARHVANLLADPTQINCPHAMTLLATGNEEARQIAVRVLKKYTIEPMMAWLGCPDAETRAQQIMALCAGFALYNTQLNTSDSTEINHQMVDWLTNSIQAIVDGATATKTTSINALNTNNNTTQNQ